MKGLNKVEIIGNLGGQPELKYTQSGKPMCRFSVAVNESWTDSQGEKQEKVEWFLCVAWDTIAEHINKYLHKGDAVYVEAKFGISEFTDQNNVKKEKAQFTVRNVIFLGQKKAQPAAPAAAAAPGRVTDDDIPF